jgi:hypothetical protein
MNDLIIARYNEPLDWIMLVPADFRIHIYNKGDPITSSAVRARGDLVDCRNAGRESESYLTHIIEHGPGSGDFTVFSQGDPFEHSPDFLDLLATWERWEAIQPLSWCWKEEANIPPPALRRHPPTSTLSSGSDRNCFRSLLGTRSSSSMSERIARGTPIELSADCRRAPISPATSSEHADCPSWAPGRPDIWLGDSRMAQFSP